MAATPAWAVTPARTIAQITGAVTTIDNPSASGGLITGGATLVTGAATGTRIISVQAIVAGTSAVGLIRLYLSGDTGVTWRLFDEILIPAVITANNTTPAARPSIRRYGDDSPLVLPGVTWKLGATSTVAQTVNLHTEAQSL